MASVTIFHYFDIVDKKGTHLLRTNVMENVQPIQKEKARDFVFFSLFFSYFYIFFTTKVK